MRNIVSPILKGFMIGLVVGRVALIGTPSTIMGNETKTNSTMECVLPKDNDVEKQENKSKFAYSNSLPLLKSRVMPLKKPYIRHKNSSKVENEVEC